MPENKMESPKGQPISQLLARLAGIGVGGFAGVKGMGALLKNFGKIHRYTSAGGAPRQARTLAGVSELPLKFLGATTGAASGVLGADKLHDAFTGSNKRASDIPSLAKLAAGRCWAGYEPVPGKAPYSNDSCRPVGSKKKKKTEKKATSPAMRDESGMNLKKPAVQPKPAPYGSANFNADAIKMMDRVRQARNKQASDIQTLAKLAADPPCSCACGDTVSTCKCGPDCKCRKEGGSCYRGEKAASLLPLALAAGAVGSYPYARGAVSAMQGPKGYGVQEGVHGYLRGIGELGGGVAGAGLGGALGPVLASKLGGGSKSQAAAALLGALSGAGLGGYGGNRLIRKLTGKSPSEKEKDEKQEKQAGKRGLWDNIHAKRKRGEKPAKPGEKDYPDSKSWTKTVKSSSEIQQLAKLAASPAWQRSEGKNSEGGLNAKGRASYNASTGGNLKAPVTSENPKGKAAKRKASFCARMGGMKSKLTGEKTKNDPDSRINKALRKWNC